MKIWPPSGVQNLYSLRTIKIRLVTIVARSAKDPEGLAKPIASAVQSLDRDVPTYSLKTVVQYLNGTIAVPRFNTFLLAIFAALAMILTAVGLYGVVSYTVAQRTHEIGIRMAWSATW